MFAAMAFEVFQVYHYKIFNPTHNKSARRPILFRVKEQLQLIIRLTKMTPRTSRNSIFILDNQLRSILFE
jgi:hypothetical protein